MTAKHLLNPANRALLSNNEEAIADYQAKMSQAVTAVSDWLRQEPMYAGGAIQGLRQAIRFEPTCEGMGLDAAVQRAITLFLNNSLKVHHPYSLAHLHCPTLVTSQIAEVLINATNQSMDSWDQSPAASLMEVQLINWLCQKVGYTDSGDGVFTSGGTQSNLMGVLLARDACIAKHWQDSDGKPWSVQRDGLPADAIHKVKVLCSANAHFSVQKNMAMMGMGFQSVISVPVNDRAQLDTHELERLITEHTAQGHIIACVVATAGTTDAGAIDDLPTIRRLTDDHGIWLHVDAAWGGALLLSNQHRHWLAGIEHTDSVTLDFHKQYFQSISCGAFLLKDKANYRFMHYEAEYLNSAYDEAHGVPNLVAKSLQTTRRFDALKLWLTVEALGETAYGAMIDHGITLTREVADYINATDGLELLVEPQFASVLFRVVPAGFASEHIDNLNQNVADDLFARGEANIGVTRVIDRKRDVQALKMTLLNPVVTLADVQALLSQVLAQAEAIKDDIAAGTHRAAID